MPVKDTHDFLVESMKTVRKADTAIPAYNLEERMRSGMWGTCVNIISIKIEHLEDLILQLKGLQKRLEKKMGKI